MEKLLLMCEKVWLTGKRALEFMQQQQGMEEMEERRKISEE